MASIYVVLHFGPYIQTSDTHFHDDDACAVDMPDLHQ